MPTPLSISTLTKTFPGSPPHPALTNINLNLPPASLLFLLGPSGCGKTTLLRTIAGLTTPDSGAVHINNRNVTTLPPHHRNIAMVFQHAALWPHMRIAENIEFPLRARGVPRSVRRLRVTQTLELVRLPGMERRRPASLSGGEQQRAALARALITQPDVLLLDEPLASLDTNLRRDLRQEITRIIRDAALTTIWVTHDRDEAFASADLIAVMRAGQLLQVATPQELRERPASSEVAEFIGVITPT